ncbi:hypothetical protein PVAP13_6NG048200 [Panicum virgatum]|uniref:Uncharacterized protein n=1 Tax=Panicum virgatum TaxID=38727 RepID=A0A8T0QVJ1_PANVG|nr:hypothetical protein PVAP13_6NG048200 [Panicum virgatum]
MMRARTTVVQAVALVCIALGLCTCTGLLFWPHTRKLISIDQATAALTLRTDQMERNRDEIGRPGGVGDGEGDGAAAVEAAEEDTNSSSSSCVVASAPMHDAAARRPGLRRLPAGPGRWWFCPRRSSMARLVISARLHATIRG